MSTTRQERKRVVLDLYHNQGKTIRDIAKEARMSFRDIGAILNKTSEDKEDGKEEKSTLNYYDKEKYREMIFDAADTVLGYFGFDRTVYGNSGNNRKKKKWYEELHEERTKDIQTEIMMEKQ